MNSESSYKFTGPEVNTEADVQRLGNQIERIKEIVLDGEWRTHQEIADATGAPSTSVSSQLRNLRMKENGGYIVERRVRGEREDSLFEYRVTSPVKDHAYYQGEVLRRGEILKEMEGRYNKAMEELKMALDELDQFEAQQISQK